HDTAPTSISTLSLHDALPISSMEQGRLAACHAFGVSSTSLPHLFPYGIYSVPEISMVGPTEEQLTSAGIPYEVGVSRYREIARGDRKSTRLNSSHVSISYAVF